MAFFFKIVLQILIMLMLISCEVSEIDSPTLSQIANPEKFSGEIYWIPDIKYGVRETNKLDVYFNPRIKERPVIIYVTGGGWGSGSKSDWGRNHVCFVDSFGFISVSIDYTLNNGYGNAKHPIMVNEVAQSVKWVYDNIEEFGGDKNRIYLMGASAGALLVDLVATDERILNFVGLPLSTIKGVISIDGGAYLTLDPIEYILPEQNSPLYESYKGLKYAYQSVFGFTFQENLNACPYNYIAYRKGIPPFLLISQGKDVVYRYKPNRMMYDKLIKNKIVATHHIAQGYEHSDIFYCIGTSKDRVNIGKSIMTFLTN